MKKLIAIINGVVCMLLLPQLCLASNSIAHTNLNTVPSHPVPWYALMKQQLELNNQLDAMYLYSDYQYNSSIGPNFNRYKGHSSFYNIGAIHYQLPKWFVGLNLVHIDSDSLVQQKIADSTFNSKNTVNGNGVVLYLNHNIFHYFYLNFLAGYSYYKYEQNTNVVNSSVPTRFTQQADYHGYEYTLGIGTDALYPHHRWLFKPAIGLNYFSTRQNSFNLNNSNGPQTFVPRTRSTSTTLFERLTVYYHITKAIMPFVSGGLIQVLNTSINSQTSAQLARAGVAPNYLITQNGFSLGAGTDFYFSKHLYARATYRYIQHSAQFHSNNIAVLFSWLFY